MFSSDEKKWRNTPQPWKGWRSVVLGSSVATAVVLIINFAITISSTKKYALDGKGNGVFYTGDCSKVKTDNRIIQLAINTISTILLTATNYCMQCLNAPTRSQVDYAHSKNRWVEIGVMRVRNLSWVGWKKIILWIFLALSSIPMHLMFNSAVYVSIAAYDYTVSAIPENMLNNYQNNPTRSSKSNIIRWDKLSNEDCIKKYATQLQTGVGDLAVVLPANSPSGNLKDYTDIEDYLNLSEKQPFQWICDSLNVNGLCQQRAALDAFHSLNGNWTVQPEKSALVDALKSDKTSEVLYCQSSILPEECGLNFNTTVMIVVIICNLVKLICIICVLFIGKEKPLLTTGDAIASFMENPDYNMSGMCLATAEDLRIKWIRGISVTKEKVFTPLKKRWYQSLGGLEFWLQSIP